MADLLLEERETHLNLIAADRSTWEVYTDDPVMIKRLDKIVTAIKTTNNGKFYQLRSDQVVLRKGKRAVSDAQRIQAAKRMKQLHKQGML